VNITLSADVVVFRRHPMRNTDTEVLLIKRPRSPSAGYWALPGGKMSEQDVTLEETARRTIQEETGMVLDPTKYELHLVGVYSNTTRDPRQVHPCLGERPSRSVSVAYWTVVDHHVQVKARSDAAELQWFTQTLSDSHVPCLACAHERILIDAFCHYQDVLDESEAPYVL
jgi:ADP-ribose pyrophosphatase YjhB (NUDIX family)